MSPKWRGIPKVVCHKNLQHPCLLCYVDVVAMSVEQAITDVLPGTFGPRPWAEELYRVSVGLRPAPIHLQGLVEPPAQIAVSFGTGVAAALLWIHGAKSLLEALVPALFPTVDPDPADRVDIRCASDLVVTDHAGLEENADRLSFIKSCLRGESFQHLPQFAC